MKEVGSATLCQTLFISFVVAYPSFYSSRQQLEFTFLHDGGRNFFEVRQPLGTQGP